MSTVQHIPCRQSLIAIVASLLRREVRAGAWTNWLTDERTLCKQLHVSRNTLRAALQQLTREGLIETIHGRGHKLLSTAGTSTVKLRKHTVGVLITKELHGDRSFTSLYIDGVRSLLYNTGIDMQLYSGRQFAKSRPHKALDHLIERTSHSCWLLCGGWANGVQRWFEQREIPTLVSGTRYPHAILPTVSIDNEAIGHKAADLILKAGHHRILAIRPGSAHEGFTQRVAEFQKVHPGARVDLSFAQYDDDADVFHRNLARLLNRREPPTAIFVNESDQYLQTVSYLMARRIRVPEEVSLVCRDSESYLDYLVPEPLRFKKSPIKYGDLLFERLIKLIRQEPITPPLKIVVSDLVHGNSLGPPP